MSETATTKTNGDKALGFVSQEPAKLAERLGYMIANGKKLAPEERLALAQYAVATGLNPFAGECYFLPGVGPGPGIAGWRVKAEEQMEYEARKARAPLARFWCDYQDPAEGEARYDAAKGDIAVKAVLHDTLTKTEWEKRILSHYIELVKNGLKENAWEIAKELAGPEPTWSAVAVVRGDEKFSFENKPEKMDRYERACKRAEKAAIRKRFPRVSLPEPTGWDETQIIDAEIREITPRPSDTIIGELGYEQETEQPASVVEVITEEGASRANGIKEAAVTAGIVPDVQYAEAALEKCELPKDAGEDLVLRWLKNYQAYRDQGETHNRAAQTANARYQNWIAEQAKETQPAE